MNGTLYNIKLLSLFNQRSALMSTVCDVNSVVSSECVYTILLLSYLSFYLLISNTHRV